MSVYFIQAGENGPVKIGHSRVPQLRLESFQLGHYEKLHLIRVVDGGRQEERWFHTVFSGLRVRGEWFRFHPLMNTTVAPDDLCSIEAELLFALEQRANGATWQQIGDALGITGQAAHGRYKHKYEQKEMRDNPPRRKR
jgi:hypothetical protein